MILLSISICLSCQSAARHHKASKLNVVKIEASKFHPIPGDRTDAALATTCRGWKLTPSQAEQFFRLSKQYEDGLTEEFYWLPCTIKGALVLDGRRWDFAINGAATAIWKNEDEVRRWGCTDPSCESLVLMMPDGNSP